MVKVKNIYNYIDELAPFKNTATWDNSGLLIGNEEKEVSSILLALDLNKGVLNEAIEENFSLIVCHHPIIFKHLSHVKASSYTYKLIKHDISIICAHTNLDVAKEGVNFNLAQKLGIKNINSLSCEFSSPYYVITTYIPKENAEVVKLALSKAGADTVGNYKDCNFMNNGIGMSTTTEGANPYIGESHESKRVEETKLEVSCHPEKLNDVIGALKISHPYKEPIYNVFKNYGRKNEYGFGLIGYFEEAKTKQEILSYVAANLNVNGFRYYLPKDKNFKCIACCGGSGGDLLDLAVSQKADVFITGDVKHSMWHKAEHKNIGLIDAGHFETENMIINYLVNKIKNHFKNVICKESKFNTSLNELYYVCPIH